MRIRAFVLLTVLPILLLLSAASAGVLYVTKDRELRTGLRDQAIAAATTVGEYLSARPDLLTRLNRPPGKEALRFAIAQISGLRGLAVAWPDGRCCQWSVGQHASQMIVMPPGEPIVSPIVATPDSEPYIEATMRLRQGAILQARMDATTLVAERRSLAMQTLLLIGFGAIAGLIITLIIVRWLERDVWAVQEVLAAELREADSAVPTLRFRETQETAEAIGLMRRNIASTEKRAKQRFLDEELTQTPEQIIAAFRAASLPDVQTNFHGVRCAISAVGTIAPGAFRSLGATQENAWIILGEVRASDPYLSLSSATILEKRLEGCRSREELASLLDILRSDAEVFFDGLVWGRDREAARINRFGVPEIATRGRFELLFSPGSQRLANDIDKLIAALKWSGPDEPLQVLRNRLSVKFDGFVGCCQFDPNLCLDDETRRAEGPVLP